MNCIDNSFLKRVFRCSTPKLVKIKNTLIIKYNNLNAVGCYKEASYYKFLIIKCNEEIERRIKYGI
ncbi:MAG: hypothetical protein WCR97_03925 [Bacilli bacterium]